METDQVHRLFIHIYPVFIYNFTDRIFKVLSRFWYTDRNYQWVNLVPSLMPLNIIYFSTFGRVFQPQKEEERKQKGSCIKVSIYKKCFTNFNMLRGQQPKGSSQNQPPTVGILPSCVSVFLGCTPPQAGTRRPGTGNTTREDRRTAGHSGVPLTRPKPAIN